VDLIGTYSDRLPEFSAGIPRASPPLPCSVEVPRASDPELARLQEEMDAARLTRMTHNAQMLLKGGHLRRGMALDAATDVLRNHDLVRAR